VPDDASALTAAYSATRPLALALADSSESGLNCSRSWLMGL
jgi:hypothetical protein